MKSMLIKGGAIAGAAILAAFLATGQASAGCNINVGVSNGGDYEITIKASTGKVRSQIKTALVSTPGPWKKLSKGGWYSSNQDVASGRSKSRIYNADFGCNQNRRFTVNYTCKGGSRRGQTFSLYSPSSVDWGKSSDVMMSADRCN